MAWREDAHINKLKVEKLYTGTPGSWSLRYLIGGVAAGYKLARGNVAATANATIATGLTTVVDFIVGVQGDSAAKANACALATGKKSATAGSLVAYRWKATSAGTTTLVAATTAGTLEWIAVGT